MYKSAWRIWLRPCHGYVRVRYADVLMSATRTKMELICEKIIASKYGKNIETIT